MFSLNLHPEATFHDRFENNRAHCIREEQAASDQFLKDHYARQAIFWARMARLVEGVA